MNITKADLCGRISKNLKNQGIKVTIDDVKAVLDIYFDEIITNLSEGQRIEIRGFGCYTAKNRKPRVGRNPRTGELYDIPGYTAPSFKFSSEAQLLLDKKLGTLK